MDRFLDYVLRQLIEFPEEMIILKEETPQRTLFRVQVSQTDIGKVVGKHGATIAAIQNLLDAAAKKHGGRAKVEVMEDRAAERPAAAN